MQPCVCLFQHIDHYSRTKAIAEQMVLSADGCLMKGVKSVQRVMAAQAQNYMEKAQETANLASTPVAPV